MEKFVHVGREDRDMVIKVLYSAFGHEIDMMVESSSFSLAALIASGNFFKSLGILKLMARKDLRSTFSSLNRDKKALDIGPYYYIAILGVSSEQQGKEVTLSSKLAYIVMAGELTWHGKMLQGLSINRPIICRYSRPSRSDS